MGFCENHLHSCSPPSDSNLDLRAFLEATPSRSPTLSSVSWLSPWEAATGVQGTAGQAASPLLCAVLGSYSPATAPVAQGPTNPHTTSPVTLDLRDPVPLLCWGRASTARRVQREHAADSLLRLSQKLTLATTGHHRSWAGDPPLHPLTCLGPGHQEGTPRG